MNMEKAEQQKVAKPRGGARPGAGRPAFQPTEKDREQVKTLSGYGLPLEQIATLIADGISVETLVKYFQRELALGKARANSMVGKTLYQKAVDGDTGAAIWWSKTQLRWKETTVNEHTGANGGPINIAAIDIKGLSDTELQQVYQLLSKATQ